MNDNHNMNVPRALRFSLKTLTCLVVFVCMALGWWVDRRHLAKFIELQQDQIWYLQQSPGYAPPPVGLQREQLSRSQSPPGFASPPKENPWP